MPIIEDNLNIIIEDFLKETNGEPKEDIDYEELYENKNIPKSYLKALIRFEKGKANTFQTFDLYSALKKINKKLISHSDDNDPNDLNFISSKLYKEYDLKGFFTMAKKQKFDLSNKIEEWIKLLFEVIVDTS